MKPLLLSSNVQIWPLWRCAARASCQKGVGGNRVRNTNFKLCRAVIPRHVAAEKPKEKATNLAVSQDWTRLRNRLQEGRVWLEVHDPFGGAGALCRDLDGSVRERLESTTAISGSEAAVLFPAAMEKKIVTGLELEERFPRMEMFVFKL